MQLKNALEFKDYKSVFGPVRPNRKKITFFVNYIVRESSFMVKWQEEITNGD
jgi:hypothetical protein